VPGAGRLQRLDAVLDFGVLAVKSLKRSDIRVGLVGDEALEAVSVHVGEGELCAGVWALTTADQPSALRPVGKVDQTRELGDPCPFPGFTARVDGGRPCVFSEREDLLADISVDRVAKREANPCLPASEREIVT